MTITPTKTLGLSGRPRAVPGPEFTLPPSGHQIPAGDVAGQQRGGDSIPPSKTIRCDGDEVGDEALMAAIQRGDEAALQSLRTRYLGTLRAIVARALPCDADVDETVQDIFLEIWRMAANYDPARGKPLGWIIRMTRRRAIDRQRKNSVRSRLGQHLAAEAQAEKICLGSGGRPGRDESPAGLSDLRRFIDRLLQGPPCGQREALELNFFGQLSQREIARRTGTPLGTVKTRLELALKKLASLSAAFGPELR